MKTQKLLVIVASVCLMAFFNVLSFAQTAQAEADPAKVTPRFVAQALKAAGFEVKRDYNELMVEEQIVLKVPITLQDWEDSGIKASLVELISEASLVEPTSAEEEGPSPEDLIKFQQLRQCLSAADFVNDLKFTRCEFNPIDVGDLFCKTGVLLEYLFDDLECIFTYLQQ